MVNLVQEKYIIKDDEGNVVERHIEVFTNCDIPEGTEINFLSKEEIAEDLVERVLSGEEKEMIRNLKENELITLHNTLGRFIRNDYGLWLAPHPYTDNSNSMADNFADQVSQEIIEDVYKRLK